MKTILCKLPGEDCKLSFECQDTLLGIHFHGQLSSRQEVIDYRFYIIGDDQHQPSFIPDTIPLLTQAAIFKAIRNDGDSFTAEEFCHD